jgi:hypothetical protein
MYGAGLVRRAEIQRQNDAEHESEPDRHVRITGEVKIKLCRVTQRCRPCGEELEWNGLGASKERGDKRREAVGDEHLLRQAGGKEGKAGPDRRLAYAESPCKLRNDVAVMDQRPSDQVRKEQHRDDVFPQPQLSELSPIGIHQESDLLEGIERDPKRQYDLQPSRRDAQKRGNVLNQEVGVFEVAQERQIEGEADP